MEIFCSFLREMDRSYSLWFLLGYHFCFFENVKTSPLVQVREVASLSVLVVVCARVGECCRPVEFHKSR